MNPTFNLERDHGPNPSPPTLVHDYNTFLLIQLHIDPAFGRNDTSKLLNRSPLKKKSFHSYFNIEHELPLWVSNETFKLQYPTMK